MIMVFGTIALLTHIAKIIALYILLWRTRLQGRKGPIQLMAFQFLLNILVWYPTKIKMHQRP